LLAAEAACAQDKTVVLQKVKERYEKAQQYSCSVLYSYFNSDVSTQEQLSGNFFRSGKAWRLNLPSLTLIFDGKIFIQVDEALKQIIVMQHAEQSATLPVIDHTKFLEQAALLTEVSNTTKYATYQYVVPGLVFNTYYDLEIDKTNWLMSAVTISTGDAATKNRTKIRVTFSQFNDKASAPKEFFSGSEYLIWDQKEIRVKPGSENYQLIIN
jgi:outer membrane lipoprotein-sorting protein